MEERGSWRRLLLAFLLAFSIALAGCSGDDGDDGLPGIQGEKGDPGQDAVSAAGAEPESCAVCHAESGAEHQAYYNELYQDGVIKVANVTYANDGTNDVVTFAMTNNGAPLDCTTVDNLNIYWVAYTGSGFEMPADRLSIKGTLSNNAGVCTSTKAGTTDYSAQNGLVVVYGYEEQVGSLPPARVKQVKYPYAGLLETGTVDYVSAANDAGCVKCHTDPYLKHGNIYAQVDDDATTDFYTCKACHLDNGDGGHFIWQLLVDNPGLIITLENELGEGWEESGDARLAPYAYKTSLMNDVHMSHAMEFPYPQSMANCVTCHEGKLATEVLIDDNFNTTTCKSCHPVTGDPDHPGPAPALKSILPAAISAHANLDATANCAGCHSDGGSLPTFAEIHSGYADLIYSAAGEKYADNITVAITEATISGTDVTFKATATGSAGDFAATDIVPAFMIGLYGYDTKDFIINGHDRWDSNCNGTISRTEGDQPIGEYIVGSEVAGCANPYWTLVSAAEGAWTITAHLANWADQIGDGTVKRVELALMPELENADGNMVGLNAVSRTFNLAGGTFEDDFFGNSIVDVNKCNNCHDQLSTTFHSGDRGGSVVVCRMCHVTLAGGSHLELQSRSIDSYVHAIHSFQAFDYGSIDFTDPVAALHYEDHTELFPYPTHGIKNCESCHNAGTYDIPSQAKSLPGLLSSSSTNDTRDREIGTVPSYITGPATRACGGCHRADLINEDDANGLAAFNRHTSANGYLVEQETGALDTVIERIMSFFE